MQLFDAITGPDGQHLERLAKGVGLTGPETAAVLGAVLPELSHNLERRTLSRGGLAQLLKTLAAAKQEDFLDPRVDLTAPAATESGNRLLGEILETKYRSRAVADRAAAQTGVDAAKIRQMLPRIANVSMAALEQQSRPALEDIFARLPGFPGGPATTTGSTSGTTIGNRQIAGGSPLPLPGDNWGGANRNRYDDLSDVLTRRQPPLQANPLWNIVRQVLGAALGFESKGIVGYVVRFIVYRFGWSILRMVLGRLFRV